MASVGVKPQASSSSISWATRIPGGVLAVAVGAVGGGGDGYAQRLRLAHHLAQGFLHLVGPHLQRDGFGVVAPWVASGAHHGQGGHGGRSRVPSSRAGSRRSSRCRARCCAPPRAPPRRPPGARGRGRPRTSRPSWPRPPPPASPRNESSGFRGSVEARPARSLAPTLMTSAPLARTARTTSATFSGPVRGALRGSGRTGGSSG